MHYAIRVLIAISKKINLMKLETYVQLNLLNRLTTGGRMKLMEIPKLQNPMEIVSINNDVDTAILYYITPPELHLMMGIIQIIFDELLNNISNMKLTQN